MLRRPFAAYRRLAASTEPTGARWLAMRRPLGWLIFVGCFLSLITAGRLVWFHVLLSPLIWSLVVLGQLALLAGFARVLRPRVALARLIDLYFVGQAPWLLLLLVASGICLFAPDVLQTYVWLSRHGLVGGATLLVAGWVFVVTLAYFREVFALTRRRAAWATLVFFALYAAQVGLYHAALDQLQPLLV